MPFYEQLITATEKSRAELLAAPIIADCLQGRVTRDSYLAFLAQAYHHVRHTTPLLMSLGGRLPERLAWMRGADLVFVVGTSGVVEPAASLVREAKRSGAFTVEVNPEATVLTPAAHLSLFGKSGEVLGEWLKF